MTTPFLNIQSLSKSFGDTQALKKVDISCSNDELLVILGPTGAGKTTLLRCIVGLETPDAGSITLESRDILGLDPAKREMALVFQNFSLYPQWSVRKNLEFPLKAPGQKLDKAEINRRIESTAEMLHITRHLDRSASQLSGGEMQRVAIGRAMVRRPKCFLLDEPLTNLDAKLRESLRVELVSLRRELGIPMIYVTHDQAEALSMADRIVVLSEGEILQGGTPQEIYNRPASPLVAKQLGQPAINLIEVEARDGQYVTASNERIMSVGNHEHEKATLGIRPEHIRLEGGSTPGKIKLIENMGACKVLVVAWLGHEFHVLSDYDNPCKIDQEIFPTVDDRKTIVWKR